VYVFVTETNGMGKKQNINNLQEWLKKKKNKNENKKHAKLHKRFTHLNL